MPLKHKALRPGEGSALTVPPWKSNITVPRAGCSLVGPLPAWHTTVICLDRDRRGEGYCTAARDDSMGCRRLPGGEKQSKDKGLMGCVAKEIGKSGCLCFVNFFPSSPCELLS